MLHTYTYYIHTYIFYLKHKLSKYNPNNILNSNSAGPAREIAGGPLLFSKNDIYMIHTNNT